ncbi:MAG: dihydrofolate reductase [Barnesiella sp.]|nr:dihydrofolate reductase [Barnesiella sp.]
MITIIAAIGRDNAIGRNGDLAFHLRADMQHFKELTTGHTVVMGRKTFDSLPKGALPNRRNIVITRNPDFTAAGTERAASLDEAIAMAAGEEIFIIGGGEIYRQALPLADRMELTLIDADTPDADTFFPAIDPTRWRKLTATTPATDESTALTYTFQTYHRF